MAVAEAQTMARELDEAVRASPSPPSLPCHHYFLTGNKPGQDPAPESPTQDWVYRRGAGGAVPTAVNPRDAGHSTQGVTGSV